MNDTIAHPRISGATYTPVEPGNIDTILNSARSTSTNEARNKRVMILRNMPNLPGYTKRIGQTMIFMSVTDAVKVIADLTRQGISWNTQPHVDGVYVSFDGQTFGATIDPKLTDGNLYWLAKGKSSRLFGDIKEMEAELNGGFNAMRAEVANEAAYLQPTLYDEIEALEEKATRQLPWLKAEKVTADGEAKFNHDRQISPTLTLKKEVASWANNNLTHAVVLAGTFREPTIRFMSDDDRALFIDKWGGKRLAQ